MNVLTLGHHYYIGIEVPVVVQNGTTCERNIPQRLRFILIQNGTGIAKIGNNTVGFVAPSILCLHEEDQIEFFTEETLFFRELVFHPSYVSPAFDFRTIRLSPQEFIDQGSPEGRWLLPFVERKGHSIGLYNIGQMSAKRMDFLLSRVSEELQNQRDSYWPCRTRSYMLELLLVVDRLYRDSDDENTMEITLGYEDIYRIIMYINGNYGEKIQISTLTEKFNMNRTTLNEQFKKATGMSVMNYLIQLRIKMAMILLKDTALQISEIMYRVGFNDTSHFIRSFKKHVGLAPSEYRETYTWLYK